MIFGVLQVDPQAVARREPRGNFARIFALEYSGGFFPGGVPDLKIIESVGGHGASRRAVAIPGEKRDVVGVADFGDGLKRPSVLETDSPLYKGYKSVMIYAKITNKELADEVFSLNYLSRVEELR